MALLHLRSAAAVLLLMAGTLLAAGGPAAAQDLPEPEGPVILTVTGHISHTTDGVEARFDRAMLEQLGMVSLDTKTPWSDAVDHYEGILARTLLDAVGAEGDTLLAGALNDYVAEIPASDFRDFDVIIALKANGTYMSPRDKGPLFIVYPFDAHPELRTEEIYARNVWQLSDLEVR